MRPKIAFVTHFMKMSHNVLTARETTLKQRQVMTGVRDISSVLYETNGWLCRMVKLHNLNMQRMNAQLVKVVLWVYVRRTLLKIKTLNPLKKKR